jgi:hypothetical protein
VAISVDNPDGLGPLLEENLAKGLVAVGDAFAEMRVTRKELLVLGDGRHSDEAASALSALEAENVEVHAIGVGALESDQLEGDPAGFKQLFPSGRWLESGDALVAEIDAFAVALGER